jgi:hypothetical protein
LISAPSFSQDKRTLDTKIADLLAQLPASDLQYTNNLMNDMLSMGESGLKRFVIRSFPLQPVMTQLRDLLWKVFRGIFHSQGKKQAG